MKIGIDIDGVLTDVGRYGIDYISKYCVENNIEYNIGKQDYDYYKTFNISKNVENDFWNKYLESYAVNEKARPFASEVIERLKADGHEIYIITARWLTNRDDALGNKMRDIVKTWLHENGIVYDKLIFSKAKQEKKSQEIVENEIDIMIEDSPNNINELSKIIPVICYDTEYNKSCIGKNIIRCYSWYDIYKKVREFLDERGE